MSDVLDGSGEVVTDGDGGSVYDGSGASSAASVTVTTESDPFIKRIKRDIYVPDFVITPFLNEVIREFTEKTWVLYRSYEVQGSGVEDSVNASVAFNVAVTVPDLVPIKVDKLRTASQAYTPVMREIVGAATRTNYETTGQKLYNFYTPDADLPKTYVRIFPWDSDPLIYLSIAFRTADEPTTFPAILLDYKEEICSGVMARMMMQPGKDWTDPKLAMFHKAEYQKGISRAKYLWFSENTAKMVTGRRFV